MQLGEWRSHHQLPTRGPSSTDETAMAEALRMAERCIMVIVTFKWSGTRMKFDVDLDAFLFQRGSSKGFPVPIEYQEGNFAEGINQDALRRIADDTAGMTPAAAADSPGFGVQHATQASDLGQFLWFRQPQGTSFLRAVTDELTNMLPKKPTTQVNILMEPGAHTIKINIVCDFGRALLVFPPEFGNSIPHFVSVQSSLPATRLHGRMPVHHLDDQSGKKLAKDVAMALRNFGVQVVPSYQG